MENSGVTKRIYYKQENSLEVYEGQFVKLGYSRDR